MWWGIGEISGLSERKVTLLSPEAFGAATTPSSRMSSFLSAVPVFCDCPSCSELEVPLELELELELELVLVLVLVSLSCHSSHIWVRHCAKGCHKHD